MDPKSPVKLWSDAFVSTGVKNVYRYTYGMFTAILSASESKDIDAPIYLGAVFADLQPLPNLGAFHGSDCKSPISRHSSMFSFSPMAVSPQQPPR